MKSLIDRTKRKTNLTADGYRPKLLRKILCYKFELSL